FRQLAFTRQIDGTREREEVRRKLIQRTTGQRTKTLRGIGFEQVRTAVNRVHRLAPAGFAGIMVRVFFVRLPQSISQVVSQGAIRKRRCHGLSSQSVWRQSSRPEIVY